MVDSQMPSIEEVKMLLLANGVPNSNLEMIVGSFSKRLFIADHTYLLRTSGNSMELETTKLRRVKGLPGVPTIVKTGTYSSRGRPIYFILATLIPGRDLFDEIEKITVAQATEIGYAASHFLNKLHMIEGSTYDIGHYVPTVPMHKGTWRMGHVEYWQRLKAQLDTLELDGSARLVINQADRHFHKNLSSLDYQQGPKLLHNDFHMKNIIIQGGLFAGVIDWECSQYGESDFELVHLVHWALDGTKSGEKITIFSKAVLARQRQFLKIPDLETRLTMYLLEHDLNQIVWAHGVGNRNYIRRIQKWLDETVKVHELFSSFH
jgi:aminoglycoside phosphotransferase (APT) family kinase protein